MTERAITTTWMRTQTATISPSTVRIVLTGKRTTRSIPVRIYDASDVRSTRATAGAGRRGLLALDRVACLRIEEVEPARVDGELGGVTDRDASARTDARTHPRPPRAVAIATELDGRVVADVRGGRTRNEARRRGAEVEQHVCSERLRQIDLDLHPPIAGNSRFEARVLEVLGPNAEDDRLADVVLQPRPVARKVVVDRQPMLAEGDGVVTVRLLELCL